MKYISISIRKIYSTVSATNYCILTIFILGIYRCGRIAHRDDAQRDIPFIKSQNRACSPCSFHIRIQTAPHRSKSARMGGQKQILGSCAAVLHPEFGLLFEHTCAITAYDDSDRGAGQLVSGIGQRLGECRTKRRIAHNHKGPRLTIDSRRSAHSGTQERIYGRIRDLGRRILTYTGTCGYAIQHCFGVRCRSSGINQRQK